MYVRNIIIISHAYHVPNIPMEEKRIADNAISIPIINRQ